MHSYEAIASTGRQRHLSVTYDAALSQNSSFSSAAIASEQCALRDRHVRFVQIHKKFICLSSSSQTL
jgi:hypothetical protein